MTSSKVVVIDADTKRAESLSAKLNFIDYDPVLVTDGNCSPGTEQSENDCLAVMLGSLPRNGFLKERFRNLAATNNRLPILLLPYSDARAEIDDTLEDRPWWQLESPLNYRQVAEFLRRAEVHARDESFTFERRRRPTGNSRSIREVHSFIDQVAGFDTTVLITGESGTGKELVARRIHDLSPRHDRPFVPINCGAIPTDLLESELFGHEKGAFTGAISARQGRFEMAEGGTLFLDEIGDMSMTMQVKLLRVLQEKCFQRVGSNETKHCDVRIIAATHRKLEETMQKGEFREDLFYRLNVFPIEMPPLRKRIDDLPSLIEDLIISNEKEGHNSIRLTSEAMEALTTYRWPGNVRELGNLVERLAILHPTGKVGLDDLPEKYRSTGDTAGENMSVNGITVPSRRQLERDCQLPQGGINLKEHLMSVELRLIRNALEEANGIVAGAARLLNLRRTTLVEKLRKYRLHDELVLSKN